MNVRKFVAPSNREALRQIKEALGPDAIILSNRSVAEGVEIMAIAAEAMGMLAPEPRTEEARQPFGQPIRRGPPPAPQPKADADDDNDEDDYRVSLSSNWKFRQPAMAKPRRSAATAFPRHASLESPFGPNPVEKADKGAGSGRTLNDLLKNGRNAEFAAWVEKNSGAKSGQGEHEQAAGENNHAASDAASSLVMKNHDEITKVVPQSVMEEIRTLRKMVEQNLAGFAWGEAARAEPVKTEVLRYLLDVGFSPRYARDLLTDLPGDLESGPGIKWAKLQAENALDVLGPESDIIDRGGFYALVGATGVGKTTTTAKLAARCVLKHGTNKVALVTTDSYRIGAYEQLRIYGRILGIPVYMAKDAAELKQILMELKYKHMVLVDTMGMSQKDPLVAEHDAMLADNHVERLLVLAATSRGDTLDEIANTYQKFDLAGCVLTKVDEAASLAAPLDTIIRHQMTLYFVSNGQRVPEDLHLPNKGYLLHRAFRQSDRGAYHLDGLEPALMMANAVSGG